MGTRKIGPAMAAGCTMIVKPAQETPLTMLLLAKLMDEAGLPKGVLSVLPTTNPGDGDHRADRRRPAAQADVHRLDRRGQGAGQAGRRQAAAESMELGGNAPFVVFDDADVDAAVDGAILAKMRNGGEACTAANRFHVANAVREEFTEKLVKRMSEFTLGNGLDDSSTLGPLINAKQVATVEDLVSDAVSRGATVAVGGVAPGGPGQLLPGHRARRRARRRPHPQGGGVRPGRADHRLRHRGGGRRRRQRHRVRAGRLHLHPSTWTARCGSPRGSSPAWSASTAA